MFCRKCGAEIKDDAKFCPNCGAGRDGKNVTGNIAQEPIQQHANTAVNNVTSGVNKRIIIIAVLVLILFGGAYSLFGGTDHNSSSVMTVKSEAIVDDYIRDSATAKAKYDGKSIKITGQVLNKNQFSNDVSFCVTLFAKNGGGKHYSVSLSIPVASVNEVNKLKNGDFVSAEGNFVGVVPQKDPLDVNIQIETKVLNGVNLSK